VTLQNASGPLLTSEPKPSIPQQSPYKDIDHDQAIVECIPAISNVVAHYFKSEAEREDALQEVLTQLVLKKDSFRGDKPFSHWALRISSRTCISKIRYSRIRHFFSIDHENAREVESEFPTPESTLQTDESKQLLHQAIEKLKAKDRELILLCDIMGKNDTEVQTILDIKSAGTFRVRKHRAREKLKLILTQLGYQHES
jgi:RNA polymerase sigma-70 factor (ECF subfamily)